jgi:transposase
MKTPSEPALFVLTSELHAHIPKRHFYEQLGQLLDLTFVRPLTAGLYAPRLGRPSLDPVVFFKCMLVAFFENVIYDTELEFRLADSLVIRKFLGYGLEERTPDESTLRKTRQAMPDEVFRTVFERVLAQCKQHGLVRGRALGTDSSYVDANASLDSLVHRELGCSYEEFMVAVRRQDEPELTAAEAQRRDRQAHLPLDNATWVSTTDPEARIRQHRDGHTHLSYTLETVVDLETGVVVQVSAEPADLGDTGTVLDRVEAACQALADLGLETAPRVLVADKGHEEGTVLEELEARGLVPLISSKRQSQGAPGFRQQDFSYNAVADTYTCPAGKLLTRRADRAGRQQYRIVGTTVCRQCVHFGRCTRAAKGRRLLIHPQAEALAANRERVHRPEVRPLLTARRTRGEAPFAYFKQFGGLRRIAGRGVIYTLKKALIAGMGWNMLRLLKVGAAFSPSFAAFAALWHLLLALWEAISRAVGGNAALHPWRALQSRHAT